MYNIWPYQTLAISTISSVCVCVLFSSVVFSFLLIVLLCCIFTANVKGSKLAEPLECQTNCFVIFIPVFYVLSLNLTKVSLEKTARKRPWFYNLNQNLPSKFDANSCSKCQLNDDKVI